MMTQFASFGAVGIIAGIFVKQYLAQTSENNKIQAQERKEDRELIRKTVNDFTDLSRTYAESISMLTNRVENVEDGMERIEAKVDIAINTKGDK